jgi:hypothetical protein
VAPLAGILKSILAVTSFDRESEALFMKRPWLLLLFLPSVAVLAQNQQTKLATRQGFTVSLPLSANPETVKIHAGVYGGKGLSLSEVQTKPGVYDYTIDVANSGVGPATALKLLVYIPGYRVVASEFSDTELQTGRVFIPPLNPLPLAVVTGSLLDSAGRPLPDQILNVHYFLTEAMRYFGYFDGSVPILPIDRAKTDSKGEFTIRIPSLLEDPFFQSNSPRLAGEFEMTNEEGTRFWDQTLAPNSFPAREAYQPLVVRKTRTGTLSGQLGKHFFRQNNLSDDLRVYVRPGDTIPTGIELQATIRSGAWSFNADLEVDGSFQVKVPAGEYDLVLWVPEIERKIVVQSGVVVVENERRVLEVP